MSAFFIVEGRRVCCFFFLSFCFIGKGGGILPLCRLYSLFLSATWPFAVSECWVSSKEYIIPYSYAKKNVTGAERCALSTQKTSVRKEQTKKAMQAIHWQEALTSKVEASQNLFLNGSLFFVTFCLLMNAKAPLPLVSFRIPIRSIFCLWYTWYDDWVTELKITLKHYLVHKWNSSMRHIKKTNHKIRKRLQEEILQQFAVTNLTIQCYYL